jgi:hypothetical protein
MPLRKAANQRKGSSGLDVETYLSLRAVRRLREQGQQLTVNFAQGRVVDKERLVDFGQAAEDACGELVTDCDQFRRPPTETV